MARTRPYPDFGLSSSGGAAGVAPLADFFKKRVLLLRRVPMPVVKELAECAVVRRYAKGQYICHTGDPAKEIWIVLDGRICVNQCGWKGNRLSIEVMIPGDVSGLAAVACSTYPGEVVATRKTSVAAVPKSAVLRIIEKHPVLAREILYAYGQRIHYVETLLMLSRESVEKRLLAALLYLYHKFGFELPLTRAEIGAMAGTTSETAIRVIKNFEKIGLLSGARGSLRIRDLARIKTRLNSGPPTRS